MYSAQSQQTASLTRVNGFIQSVYNWMAIGLAITGFIAFYLSRTVILPPVVFFTLLVAELGLVVYLSARIHKIKASTATALFVLYSAMNGVTLSALFYHFTGGSIFSTFFICAATFGACSVYGMVTKRDLTSLGGFMFMGLIGMIIATIVNLFIGSAGLSAIITYVGVLVFVGLTAYDTQKLKVMAMSQPDGLSDAVIRKGAIQGALTLYLDFLNLFIMLLHILGDRD